MLRFLNIFEFQSPCLRATVAESGAIFLPFAVACIQIPIGIYTGNQYDLGFERGFLLPPFLAAIAACVVLQLAFMMLSDFARHTCVRALFALGVLMVLSEFGAPLQMTGLSGGLLSTPPQPLGLVLLQAFLAVMAVWGGFCLSWPLVKFSGVALSLAITAGGAVQFLMLKPAPTLSVWSTQSISRLTQSQVNRGNIYHLLFDGYSSDVFDAAIQSLPQQESFRGFTFFKNARANYLRTEESVPSFLTGGFADLGRVGQWVTSFRERGMFSDALRSGFDLYQYTIDPRWLHPSARYQMQLWDVRKEYKRSAQMWLFYDLCLVRAVPVFLRQTVFDQGKGLLSKKFSQSDTLAGLAGDIFLSYDLFQAFLQDEARRGPSGNYVYVHVLLPHSPFIFDRDCRFVKSETDYTEQSTCAVKLMQEFIQMLKKSGKFDDAMIIIQSDHGEYFLRPSLHATITQEQDNAVLNASLLGMDAARIDARSRALLLIKPSNSLDVPLVVSDREAQLLDLAPTLAQALGTTVQGYQGAALLLPQFPVDREIHIFDGFAQNGAAPGVVLRFGQGLTAGEVNHFSYSRTTGWHVYPNPQAHW